MVQSEVVAEPQTGAMEYNTPGQLADAYYALSESDRGLFLTMIGQLPIVQPNAGYIPQIVGPAGAAGQPVLAQQAQNAPLAPGMTRDPKTGRIYRIQPPKQRPAEFQQLQGRYDSATQQLGDYLRSKGWSYDLNSGETLDHSGTAVQDEELVRYQENLEDAKRALKEWKSTHRQIAETPQRGGMTRGSRVPTRGTPNIGRGQRRFPA